MEKERKILLLKMINLSLIECLEKGIKEERLLITWAVQYGKRYNVTREEIKNIIDKSIKELL